MMRCAFVFLFLTRLGSALAFTDTAPLTPQHELLVIVGASGEDSYEAGFKEAANDWLEAAKKSDAKTTVIGLETRETANDKEKIENWFHALDPRASVPVWVVYIGHGTHNRKRTLLNLRGPDLDATTLSEWVAPLDRPFIFVHGGSASAPFIPALSGPNRIVITATRSGDEINYARFGERFAKLLSMEKGDLDQDGQTSLLEAFVSTSQDVQLIYKESGRLASEHALIDDNGDSIGTPAEWFRGTRVTKTAKDAHDPDGFRAHQIAFISSPEESKLTSEQKALRNRLELEIEELRKRKADMDQQAYYDALEAIFLELSAIYLPDESGTETSPADMEKPENDS